MTLLKKITVSSLMSLCILLPTASYGMLHTLGAVVVYGAGLSVGLGGSVAHFGYTCMPEKEKMSEKYTAVLLKDYGLLRLHKMNRPYMEAWSKVVGDRMDMANQSPAIKLGQIAPPVIGLALAVSCPGYALPLAIGLGTGVLYFNGIMYLPWAGIPIGPELKDILTKGLRLSAIDQELHRRGIKLEK